MKQKGFDMVRKEGGKRAGGGVAIFINNKLKYAHKDGLFAGDSKIEVCAIELILATVKY
jgi:hypothetical protein